MSAFTKELEKHWGQDGGKAAFPFVLAALHFAIPHWSVRSIVLYFVAALTMHFISGKRGWAAPTTGVVIGVLSMNLTQTFIGAVFIAAPYQPLKEAFDIWDERKPGRGFFATIRSDHVTDALAGLYVVPILLVLGGEAVNGVVVGALGGFWYVFLTYLRNR